VDEEILGKLNTDRFHLVVVGEFNHGKTTLVNALLGSEVLPVGVTPTTSVIHHVVHGAEAGARVVRRGADGENIPFSQVPEFASGGPFADEAVEYLEVRYPSELLRDRIVLVDTPGVNDLSLTRAEITFDYVPRADAVLFVLDAGQLVKESEREFLEQRLLERSRDKIVFVINKADIWTDGERAEALAYARGRLQGLVADPAVFAVSATAALSGRREASGLDELRAHLAELLTNERGRILLQNVSSEGLVAAAVLGRGIDARRRAGRMTRRQLTARVQALQEDLAGHRGTIEERRLALREEAGAIKAWARRDLERFCDEMLRALPAMLERVSGDDVKQHLGAFLEESFRTWAQAETEEIASALERLAERTVALLRDDAHDVAERVSETVGRQLVAPTIEVDTFAFDMGVFAVLSLGLGVVFANALLGGALLVAAPALALYGRDRAAAEIRRRAHEAAGVVLRDTAREVGPKLDEMVDDFRAALDAWVVSAGEELHREIIEILTLVHEERRSGQVDAEAESKRCDRAAEQLARITHRLTNVDVRVREPGEVVGGDTVTDAGGRS
jgi:small GTP-binding protein